MFCILFSTAVASLLEHYRRLRSALQRESGRGVHDIYACFFKHYALCTMHIQYVQLYTQMGALHNTHKHTAMSN